MAVSFNPIGQFGGPGVLANPTSLDFGPDSRLYVAQQNGVVKAITTTIENGEYVAAASEELLLPNGGGIVKSIQNHNDNGTNNSSTNRQVTGLLVAGTAANPILYISSSDPRIGQNGETFLDTNSGVITQATWTGSQWQVIDIIRGLPRSEENHSNNGLLLSPDGTKLLVAVGGNTNNGAPSQFFSYTGEYALSGTVLEIDLADIASRPVLTDPVGGQGGTPRQYVYDLPTLDDPSVPNDGVREDANGMDVAGPWGGNDGFNMAILPADAPLRIFADGFRNHYDLVWTETGKLYTVDNGSNTNLGGDPVFVNGEVTNLPNNGGTGDPEPLFLLEDGGYYGHPNPARSNQDLAWTVYDNAGNPDATITPNSVSSLAALVPPVVNMVPGFIIDPSKFTGVATRLEQSGIRIPFNSAASPALVTIGSSSNGLVEYTADAFNGELKGDLLVAQFNGNVGRLNLSADGTSATYETIDGLSGLSTPLDVTVGPDGTVWVAEIGGDFIKVFAPSDLVLPNDPDFDNDGILNVSDPFVRDANNGRSVLIVPGQSFLWDFDANQDDNLPGPNGYGGGLTGVMIDGTTDFEQFFQEPSSLPGQNIKLDNVKFITAAGGGTTVVESVSNGDPTLASNSGEYLFHTGVALAPTVETLNIRWGVYNPGTSAAAGDGGLTGAFQQIGGYLGTGDQSNFLKIVAVKDATPEFQVVLEDNDVTVDAISISARDLFDVTPSDGKKIFLDLDIDLAAETAVPTITYETLAGSTTVTGTAISLTGSTVLEVIRGNYTVQGQSSGLAVGLFSTNTGQPGGVDAFQAVFDDIEINATGDVTEVTLYRVNAGGSTIAAIDGGPDWTADTQVSNSSYLVTAGSNSVAAFSAVEPGNTVPTTTPGGIFDTERWDSGAAPEMAWSFPAPVAGLYEVRLYMGNGFTGTSTAGSRIFDVAIEGQVPSSLNDIDLSGQFGHLVGAMVSNVVAVSDGAINIEFSHGVENPLINGIEIIQLGGGTPSDPTVSILGGPLTVGEGAGQAVLSLTTDVPVPAGQTVSVTFEIIPGTATPLEDYEYLSSSATYVAETGTYTDTLVIAENTSSVSLGIEIVPDTIEELDEAFTVNILSVSSNAQLGTPTTTTVTIQDDDSPVVLVGEAVVSVTVNSNNVQISNFGNNSFQVTNTGDKKIASVVIDVTNALYPDTVFDPFGVAGDTVAKQLTINTAGGTGVVAPNASSYIGSGGTAGFEAIQLVFDEAVNNGFEPGETLGFSVDMDPNSIAGSQKATLDAGSNPSWDVGGVSGAELIGSTVTVTFLDGTTAVGQLQGAGNQGGSQTWVSQASPNSTVSLTVNGLVPGEVGTYDQNGPSVVVNGPAGQTARIVLTKGFIQPVTNEFYNSTDPGLLAYAPVLQAQLDALAASDFPANNAVEFQTVNVLLTGVDQNISNLFNFTGVANYNFAGEGQVPLGFVAGIVDTANSSLPIGPVTDPIYLVFDEAVVPTADLSLTQTVSDSSPVSGDTIVISLSVNNAGPASATNISVQNLLPGGLSYVGDTSGGAYDPSTGIWNVGTLPATGIAAIDITVNVTGDGVHSTYAQVLTSDVPDPDSSPGNDSVGEDDDATTTITAGVKPTVSIVSGSASVSEAAGQIQISLLTDITVPSDQTVQVTFQIVPVAGQALPKVDYDYPPGNYDSQTGIYTGTIVIAGSSSDATILIDILQDTFQEVDESFVVNLTGVSANAQLGVSSATITIKDDDSAVTLFRVNAGGPQIVAIDAGPNWVADTRATPSTFLADPGSNSTLGFSAVEPGSTVPSTTPGAIFDTERYDVGGGTEMTWSFPVPVAGLYEVRLYVGNGWSGTNDPGERVFDASIEGQVPSSLNDIDLSGQFGHLVGAMVSNVVAVSDGAIDLVFLHGVQNPLVNGIEIIQLGGSITQPDPIVSVAGGPLRVSEGVGQAVLSLETDALVPSGQSVAVTFEIVPGNATPRLDYAYESTSAAYDAITGAYTDTLVIAENTSSVTLPISILQDSDEEVDESFTVRIIQVSGNAQLGTDTTTITIEDDDIVVPTADLQISQIVSDLTPFIGDTITISLTVSNAGDSNATGVTVQAQLPSGLAYAGDSGSGTYDPSTGIWSIGMVPVGGAVSLDISATVTNVGTFSSYAQVLSSDLLDPDSTPGDGSTGEDDDATATIVAVAKPTVSITNGSVSVSEDAGQAQVLLSSDVIIPAGEVVVVTFEIVPISGQALPGVDYAYPSGSFDSLSGTYSGTIEIAGSTAQATILIDILQDQEEEFDELFTVNLVSVSTNAQLVANTATVTIQDDDRSAVVLYRVNAGGSQVIAVDGGPNWSADTVASPSPFISSAGSNSVAAFSAVEPGGTVPLTTPGAIFDSERFDSAGGAEMAWSFPVAVAGLYEVRLYLGNGWNGTNDPGERVFDVAVEGQVPPNLDNVDLSGQFGHLVGAMISTVVSVSDGSIQITFVHGVQNPLVNGIEILRLGASVPPDALTLLNTSESSQAFLSQSPGRAQDVNRDGSVTALDAIIVINSISREQESALNGFAANDGQRYLADVNRDGKVSASDALSVINFLAIAGELREPEAENAVALANTDVNPRIESRLYETDDFFSVFPSDRKALGDNINTTEESIASSRISAPQELTDSENAQTESLLAVLADELVRLRESELG